MNLDVLTSKNIYTCDHCTLANYCIAEGNFSQGTLNMDNIYRYLAITDEDNVTSQGSNVVSRLIVVVMQSNSHLNYCLVVTKV